jgi:cell division protein FtsB
MKRGIKVANFLVLTFFILSLFLFIYNVFLSENSYHVIPKYKSSIKYLSKLVNKEKQRKLELEQKYQQLLNNRQLYLNVFVRDYLFMISPDSWIILKSSSTGKE